jgi:hypothetical protein
MYRLTIELDWASDETLIINSHDFDKLQIIQQFIMFQQEHGWAVDYVATEPDDEDFEDEDTEEEEIPPFALDSKEEL